MSVGVGSALALLRPLSLNAAQREPSATNGPPAVPPNPLRPPIEGDIPVAFLISEDAVVIDFAGPWEVFERVRVPNRSPAHPFRPYTVAETTAPIHAGGSMTIVPNFSFATAPMPKVLVIPAQSDPTDAVIAWVRKVTKTSDLTMSVCTGAAAQQELPNRVRETGGCCSPCMRTRGLTERSIDAMTGDGVAATPVIAAKHMTNNNHFTLVIRAASSSGAHDQTSLSSPQAHWVGQQCAVSNRIQRHRRDRSVKAAIARIELEAESMGSSVGIGCAQVGHFHRSD